MKLTQLLLSTTILLFISSCCAFLSDDEAAPTIDITLQLFDNLCNENLFDVDGPLTLENISFESGTEGRVIEPNDFDADGNISFSLFGQDLNFDEATGSNAQLFIQRDTGERDTLLFFTERRSGDCGSSFIVLTRAEFNGNAQDIERGSRMTLKLS